MKKNKKILILGGTGFLGFHISKYFLKKNWEVISISRKKAKFSRYIKKIKYIYADTTKYVKLKKKLKTLGNIEYIINASGEVDHKYKNKVFASHYLAVKNISKVYLGKNLKKFFQIGSSLEYGKTRSPHKENSKCKPISFYGKSKLRSTNFLIGLNNKKKFPSVILRLYQVYGPNQDINRFMPIVINNCLKNKKFPCSDGNQKRDFLYIDDFVKCIYQLIKAKSLSKKIYNIGYGRPQKIKDIIIKIKSIVNQGKPDYGKIKMRREESLLTYPSINELSQAINWKPTVSIDSGIKKTINFYKKL